MPSLVGFGRDLSGAPCRGPLRARSPVILEWPPWNSRHRAPGTDSVRGFRQPAIEAAFTRPKIKNGPAYRQPHRPAALLWKCDPPKIRAPQTSSTPPPSRLAHTAAFA